MEEKLSINQCLMILNALPNLGPCTYKTLLQHFHDIRNIFKADPNELKKLPGIGNVITDSIINHKKIFNLKEEEEKLQILRGDFYGCQHENFPSLLNEIYDTPIGIYCIGNICKGSKKIAIIGSRNATTYGMITARKLAIELVEHGFCIVSGLAKGIDSSAHEGAIAAGGETIAVLGNGVDVIYPPENSLLYRKIISSGAIVSEFILGRRADKQTFPTRNRLISGLCDALIIVESDIHGGSMITAKHAIEQGRHVFAVPGRIDQHSSAGCLALIRAGASLLRTADDLLEEISYLNKNPQSLLNFDKQPSQESNITCPVGTKIYESLKTLKIADIETIASFTELPIQTIMSSAQLLEIHGHIERLYDGKIRLKND